MDGKREEGRPEGRPRRSGRGLFGLPLGRPAELVADALHDVDRLAVALEAVLPQPALHADVIAGFDIIGHVFDRVPVENDDLVPVRFVDPFAVLLVGSVRGERYPQVLFEALDLLRRVPNTSEVLHHGGCAQDPARPA
jgi:hypothetical protein